MGWVPIAYMHREQGCTFDELRSYIDAAHNRAWSWTDRSQRTDGSLIDPLCMLVQIDRDAEWHVTAPAVQPDIQRWRYWLLQICWPTRPRTEVLADPNSGGVIHQVANLDPYAVYPDERVIRAAEASTVEQLWDEILG